jgi:arylsulfatase A-like enzyme
MMPTIADLAGVSAPENIDGVSFAPLLKDGAQDQRQDALYWEYHAFQGMQGVRMGDWKGVRLRIRENPGAPILLFDLATDPNETTDVAQAHPDVVARIDSVMRARTISEVQEWNFMPRTPAE